MTYTDEQLKRTLAKMLPENVVIDIVTNKLHWKSKPNGHYQAEPVLDTELLHLCWMVEELLQSFDIEVRYCEHLYVVHLGKSDNKKPKTISGSWLMLHSTWQQRTVALAKTLGVEIL